MIHWGETAAAVATGVGILTGAGAVFGYVRSVYRRTLGRRRTLAARLGRVTAGMQLAHFEQILGVPAYRARDNANGQHLTWVEPDAYAQAFASDGTVVTFSVTTRNRQFAPRLFRRRTISTGGDSLEVRLGRTRFGELSAKPVGIAGSVGARRFGYSEIYYFGNPGHYQTFAYSINDAGFHPKSTTSIVRVLVKRGGLSIGQTQGGTPLDEAAVEAYLREPEVDQARRESIFNTLTVSAPMAGLDAGNGWLGADLDLVRTAPDFGYSPRLTNLLRSLARQLRRGSRGHEES